MSERAKNNISRTHLLSDRDKTHGAETRIFLTNNVNTMAADALNPCMANTPATMGLTMHVLVFHGEGFQRPVPYVIVFPKHKVSMTMVNITLGLSW